VKRRSFFKYVTALSPIVGARNLAAGQHRAPSAKEKNQSRSKGAYGPGRIPNEYNLFLPGEREALQDTPKALAIGPNRIKVQHQGQTKTLEIGDAINDWQLVAIVPWLNRAATAIFEKHVTHQGAIVYLTEAGEIANIPKRIGALDRIRPRAINTPHTVQFERKLLEYAPGPDVLGDYILNSAEDPCYENVAALGPEFIGWTLVANEETGPETSLWLEADGSSRQLSPSPDCAWAPDTRGRLFEPGRLLPSDFRAYSQFPYLYEYVPGYSKRTLLAGYLPVADTGVWNPDNQVGYEVIMVLPLGQSAKPVARVRAQLPASYPRKLVPSDQGITGLQSSRFVDQYWNGTPAEFWTGLVGVWNRWHDFFENKMHVEIPDEWLLDAARAGIVLSRCSYRGLKPTYQIGEGGYTKISERSHALFPVASYEFVWAHQLWNLTQEADPYFEHYLESYVLPDGNFRYNTQDQVEAPLNVGVFLENSARAYDYTQDVQALKRRLPTLRRMVSYVLRRYQYSKETFPADDPRHGLIWGSAEADNGDPRDDFPEAHPYYYQNATWTWRGLHEHARCLERAADEHNDDELRQESQQTAAIARQMRAEIESSLQKTLAARSSEMKAAEITPFAPFDTDRKPTRLGDYENHRYMSDWWLSDWGEPALDEGHFKHREIAGMQILRMNAMKEYPMTGNFMEHGNLAGRIRQEDYRPFLAALYGNVCYAMDSGNRYSPEDTILPGSHPLEGTPGAWSAVVNSELQPTVGLRWLLCYEEHDKAVVHLQKAAPKHWFTAGEKIHVKNCPTRFGYITWTTESLSGSANSHWRCRIELKKPLKADLVIHIHPPHGQPLKSTSAGSLQPDRVVLSADQLAGKKEITVDIA
jgi:hypothetical protein